MKKKGRVTLFASGLLLLLALGSILSYQQKAIRTTKKAIEYSTYDKHFALISSDTDQELWDSVYASAQVEGKESGVYVERFGSNLAVKYSKNQLMELAIEASVDGIIVEGDDSEETTSLINEAVDKGIPVITVLTDCSNSERQSYVGINSYAIGQQYGYSIMKSLDITQAEPSHVLVVMSDENENSGQSRMLMGIRETLVDAFGSDKIDVESVSIDETDNFAMEEYMRDLFLDSGNQPDYLVCLDSLSTTQAYSASVNYNAVGKMQILGYYDSESILNSISKGLLNMTISLDTQQMGKECVDALLDYENTGYTNGYKTVDIHVIDKEAAQALLSEEGEE